MHDHWELRATATHLARYYGREGAFGFVDACIRDSQERGSADAADEWKWIRSELEKLVQPQGFNSLRRPGPERAGRLFD